MSQRGGCTQANTQSCRFEFPQHIYDVRKDHVHSQHVKKELRPRKEDGGRGRPDACAFEHMLTSIRIASLNAEAGQQPGHLA